MSQSGNEHENDGGHDSGHENVPIVKKTYKARGMTVKRNLINQISKGGPKTHVDWNLKGQSYGPGHKELSTFGGSKVKQVIPITINSWNERGNKILPKLKDDLWEMIKNVFDVQDSHRDTILSELAKIHRKWRADVAKKYIFDRDGNINLEPPLIYHGIISHEDWIIFVKKHTENEEFMALKKENQQKAKKVDYPYRAGSAGYAGVEAQMLEAQGKKPSEESVDRHILWLEARQTKDGQLIDPKTKEIAHKIESISQSVNQGEIPDCEDEQDILARALELEEYSGRMRGMGHGVVSSKVFKKAKKRSSLPSCNNCETLQKVSDDRYFELSKKIEQLEAQNRESSYAPSPARSSHAPSPMSVIDSHSFVIPSIPENIEIDLFILPPTHVATGFLCDQSGATMHTQPIPDGYVKVRVDIAFVEDAPLPVPIHNAEIIFVGQAVGTFVLWPKNLIKPKVAPQPYKKPPSPKAPSPTPSKAPSPKAPSKQITAVEKFKQRDWIAFMAKKIRSTFEDNELIGVSFPKEICGVGDQVLVINKEDISCVIKGEWATNVAIRINLRHLYLNCLVKKNLEKKYVLMCPDTCAIIDMKSKSKLTKKEIAAQCKAMETEISNYMAGRFLECCAQQSDDVIFLAPINLRCAHWILLVINPKKDLVYYLDSAGWKYSSQPSLFIAVNTAITQYWALREDRTQFRKAANATRWVEVNVPKQANNDDCGYFVMQFMKEIVLNEQTVIPKNYFPHCAHKDYNLEIQGIKNAYCRYVDFLLRECRINLENM